MLTHFCHLMFLSVSYHHDFILLTFYLQYVFGIVLLWICILISLNLLLVFVSSCYRYLSTYGFIFSSLLLHHFSQLVVDNCLNVLMVFVLSWIYIFILLVAVFPSICCQYLSPSIPGKSWSLVSGACGRWSVGKLHKLTKVQKMIKFTLTFWITSRYHQFLGQIYLSSSWYIYVYVLV